MPEAGRRLLASILILSSTLLFLLPATMAPQTQATSPNASQVHLTFWLNGSIVPSGPRWNNSLPGPPLVVSSGDRVTLMLKSADPLTHEWFIDFNNDSVLESNETFVSPPTFPTSYVNYTFTPVIGVNVTRAGTYAYRCFYHPGMLGSIIINRPPPAQLIASFTVSPAAPVPGQTVTFTPLVSGGTLPYSFSWNFGDSTANSTAQIPTHSYSSPGTFTVELNVTDSSSPKHSSSSTSSVVVSLLPPPVITLVRLYPNPTVPGSQVLLDFTATYSNGPVTGTWIDWGDRSTPDLLFNMTSASMCPKLVPGSQSTQCAIAPGDLILAQPQDPSTIVNGSIIIFSPPQNPTFVIVHRVVGIMPPTATNPEYSFKTQGDTNAFPDCFPSAPSCYFPATWILAVYLRTPIPLPKVVCIPENPCPEFGPGARYDYHTYPDLNPPQTQTYTVKINATDTDGTHAEIATVETVNDLPPSVTISNLSASTITLGSTTTLTFSATDTDGSISSITINWGDGTTSADLLGTTTSQMHKYTSTGTFTISVYATDSSGSTSSAATSTVMVNPPSPSAPAPRILGLDPTLFYVLVAVGLAAVATATVIALRARRPRT